MTRRAAPCKDCALNGMIALGSSNVRRCGNRELRRSRRPAARSDGARPKPAGRPRSMLLCRVLQSRRSASAATPSKWPFKQRAAGCRVLVLSGSEAGCVRCDTAPETNPRGGRRCAAQRTLWSGACEGRRAASWHTSLSMRKSAMATFRERHCYRPKIAWQRVYD